MKEPRYHGNKVLSTVKEVKTYNGNISISTKSPWFHICFDLGKKGEIKKDEKKSRARTLEAEKGGVEKVERG